MASWTDVTAALKKLPECEREAGTRQWRVKKALLAWERPLRKSDLEALGDAAPQGAILGVRVPLEVKEALVDSGQKAYFTTPHFNGYPAVLVHLPSISAKALRGLLESAHRELLDAKPARRAAAPKRSTRKSKG
jgi:hypothetical protein